MEGTQGGHMLKRDIITEALFARMIEVYNRYEVTPDAKLNIDSCWYIEKILVESNSLVIYDQQWRGFLIVFFGEHTVYLNPWFFGGKPIGERHYIQEYLTDYLKAAQEIFEKTSFEKLLLLADTENTIQIEGSLIRESGLIYQYDYATMVLEIAGNNLKEFPKRQNLWIQRATLEDINQPLKKELVDIFHESFGNGDARFYCNLTAEEKDNFFEELGYNQAIENGYSKALYYDQNLIGFSLVYEQGEDDLQISCMCIKPEYIHKGLGKLLLEYIIREAYNHKIYAIHLGTETTMSAYKLYQHYGFKTTKLLSFYLNKTF